MEISQRYLWLLFLCAVFIALSLAMDQYIRDAYGDLIPYIGVSIEDKTPQLCIYEPPNTNVNFTDRHILNETLTVVGEWETALLAKAPKGNWHFDIKYYLATEHKDKEVDDSPSCNIYIIYTQYANRSQTLGETYYDYSKSWHKYSFVQIFTDRRDFNLKIINTGNTGNHTMINATIGMKERPLNTGIIGQIIKHEMGHVLGLDHYIDNTLENKSSDLMKPQMNDRIYDPTFEITENDINALIKLYGEDGFGGIATAKSDPYIINN